VEHHKRRWSVIYEGDVSSAWEWCQIKLHTSCDVPAPLNHLGTTVVDDFRSLLPQSSSLKNKNILEELFIIELFFLFFVSMCSTWVQPKKSKSALWFF
jgi:hypothetical protein